jgi:hypothetical protein
MDDSHVSALLQWMQLARTTLEAIRETMIGVDQRHNSLAASRRLAQAQRDLLNMEQIEQRVRRSLPPTRQP